MITNKINNKKYVGFTKHKPEGRWKGHCGERSKQLIAKKIRQYGKENFIFEVICQSLDGNYCLGVLEPYFIEKYDTLVENGNGYNVAKGGTAPWNLDKKGEYSLGPCSEETKIKIRHSNLGLKRSEETKRKLSESHLGQIPWNYGMKGGKCSHTDKTKEKFKGRYAKQYTIKHKDGRIETITNLKLYCIENGLKLRNARGAVASGKPYKGMIIQHYEYTNS